MNILFLSAWYPYPADNGSKLRIFNLLQSLARDSSISLLVHPHAFPAETPGPLAELCREVLVVPRRPFNPTSLRSLAGFLRPEPRSLIDIYEPRMAAAVGRLAGEQRFDLLIASQWQTAAYAGAAAGLPAIFEEVELGVYGDAAQRGGLFRRNLRAQLRWFKLKYYLHRLSRNFSAMTVVSEDEKRLVEMLMPQYPHIHVVPNAVDLRQYPPDLADPRPGQLIFTGAMTYPPNRQAMVWFVREVFPLVRAKRPDAQLWITGERRAGDLPDTEGVILTGYMDDIRPAIASSWVSLAPIFEGGGTRLKILEALALGTPVVTTTKGAEGLDLESGTGLLVADSPADFAAALVRILDDPLLRRDLSQSGRRAVAEKYDWEAVFPRFQAIAESVAASSD